MCCVVRGTERTGEALAIHERIRDLPFVWFVAPVDPQRPRLRRAMQAIRMFNVQRSPLYFINCTLIFSDLHIVITEYITVRTSCVACKAVFLQRIRRTPQIKLLRPLPSEKSSDWAKQPDRLVCDSLKFPIVHVRLRVVYGGVRWHSLVLPFTNQSASMGHFYDNGTDDQ